MVVSSRFRFPVCSHTIVDKEVWRNWRKEMIQSLKCATASTISSYYGHHYTSFRQTMLDTLIDKQPEPMAAKAMKHGEDNEPKAKMAYLKIMSDVTVYSDGQVTDITGIVPICANSTKATFIMTTPDMIIKRDEKREIVEFKCPYFEIFMSKNRKNRTIEQIARDFLIKYPYGKEGSFMQATVYGLCAGDIECVNVVYYFNDGTDDEALVVYSYEISQILNLEDVVVDAAAKIQHELSQEPGDIRYRTKPRDKAALTSIMKRAYYDSSIYCFDDMWKSLDEDASNNSEENGPHEPGEVSSGSL